MRAKIQRTAWRVHQRKTSLDEFLILRRKLEVNAGKLFYVFIDAQIFKNIEKFANENSLEDFKFQTL